MEPRQFAFIAVCAGICAYAVVRGGAPERIVAATFLIGMASTIIVRPLHPGIYRSLEVGVALVDFAMFAIILVVALASARFWPMLMASMQGAELLGHLAEPLGPGVLPQAYYVTVALWSYPMLVLLAVATVRHRARLARYAADPDWVWTLPAAYRAGAPADEAGPIGRG